MQSGRCRVCQRCAVCRKRQSDRPSANNSHNKSSGFSGRMPNGQCGDWSYGQSLGKNNKNNKR